MADTFFEAMTANLGGDASALEPFLADPTHVARARVYQNNMLTALGQVIVDAYPVTAKLVGNEFMRALARAYVETHPACSPVLNEYGAPFPEFVESFPPAQGVPYLADVARLDHAYQAAVFAADEPALVPADLSGLSDEDIAALMPGLHPSVQLVTSNFNALEIWQANRSATEGKVSLVEVRTFAVLARGQAGVAAHDISQTEYEFLQDLAAGKPLGTAIETDDAMAAFSRALAAGWLGAVNKQDQ